MFKFGWKQSSGDLGITPFNISKTVIDLGTNKPNEYIIKTNVPVYHQGQTSSCVSNACIGMLAMLQDLANNKPQAQLSRLFLYWNARAAIGETDKDKGSFIHDALASLKTTGVCEESFWPFSESDTLHQPNQLAYKRGDDNQIGDYYEITATDNERLLQIEAAIKANHPVVFGTAVGTELLQYQGEGISFDLPKKSIGGHAMCVVGVRRNNSGELEFLIRNSWGSGWGINGHCWFSSSYMLAEETDDIFVGTNMPNLLV